MILSALIRKRDTGNLATAIPAISATQPKRVAGTVARVATVAVANPKDGQTAPLEKVGPGATAPASRWWLIHYVDRNPLEVVCYPEATHYEILERHPDAIAAEPFTPNIRPPSTPLTAREEGAIRAWLALIEEADQAIGAEVVGQCQRDADARDYFTERAAAELPKPDPFPDDRRTCSQCLNLRGRTCNTATPEFGAPVVANRGYRPDPARLLRCMGYVPSVNDSDQRTGEERWPGIGSEPP